MMKKQKLICDATPEELAEYKRILKELRDRVEEYMKQEEKN